MTTAEHIGIIHLDVSNQANQIASFLCLGKLFDKVHCPTFKQSTEHAISYWLQPITLWCAVGMQTVIQPKSAVTISKIDSGHNQ